MKNIVGVMSSKIDLDEKYINNIIKLLENGCTIAFIARYRKDMIGNASDEVILKFQEIYEYSLKLQKRKEDILNILKEKDVLTAKIESALNEASTLIALEDIYEPYKGVKSTRADNAIKNNLEGLANIISSMKYTKDEVKQKINSFLNDNVKNTEEAIKGAQDIISLRYSQEIKTKEAFRNNLANHANIAIL